MDLRSATAPARAAVVKQGTCRVKVSELLCALCRQRGGSPGSRQRAHAV